MTVYVVTSFQFEDTIVDSIYSNLNMAKDKAKNVYNGKVEEFVVKEPNLQADEITTLVMEWLYQPYIDFTVLRAYHDIKWKLNEWAEGELTYDIVCDVVFDQYFTNIERADFDKKHRDELINYLKERIKL